AVLRVPRSHVDRDLERRRLRGEAQVVETEGVAARAHPDPAYLVDLLGERDGGPRVHVAENDDLLLDHRAVAIALHREGVTGARAEGSRDVDREVVDGHVEVRGERVARAVEADERGPVGALEAPSAGVAPRHAGPHRAVVA